VERWQCGINQNNDIKVSKRFEQKTKKLGMEFKIDKNFLLRSESEDAE
jgi:hypothetical protein